MRTSSSCAMRASAVDSLACALAGAGRVMGMSIAVGELKEEVVTGTRRDVLLIYTLGTKHWISSRVTGPVATKNSADLKDARALNKRQLSGRRL